MIHCVYASFTKQIHGSLGKIEWSELKKWSTYCSSKSLPPKELSLIDVLHFTFKRIVMMWDFIYLVGFRGAQR